MRSFGRGRLRRRLGGGRGEAVRIVRVRVGVKGWRWFASQDPQRAGRRRTPREYCDEDVEIVLAATIHQFELMHDASR
jgi:hypothetical protein